MELRVRQQADAPLDSVSRFNPLPVAVQDTLHRTAFNGTPFLADLLWRSTQEGRLFVAADGAIGNTVTGQTSFVATTPTFLLRVPAGVVAVPLFLNLDATGTVAGGPISVGIEADLVDRYASGGTSEKILNLNRMVNRASACTVYTNPTAATGYGIQLAGMVHDQTIASASSAPFWRPVAPHPLMGPAALNIFTWAATTGPTWLWSLGWAEWTLAEFMNTGETL